VSQGPFLSHLALFWCRFCLSLAPKELGSFLFFFWSTAYCEETLDFVLCICCVRGFPLHFLHLLVDRPVLFEGVGELGDFCGLFVKIGPRFRQRGTLCGGILNSPGL